MVSASTLVVRRQVSSICWVHWRSCLAPPFALVCMSLLISFIKWWRLDNVVATGVWGLVGFVLSPRLPKFLAMSAKLWFVFICCLPEQKWPHLTPLADPGPSPCGFLSLLRVLDVALSCPAPGFSLAVDHLLWELPHSRVPCLPMRARDASLLFWGETAPLLMNWMRMMKSLRRMRMRTRVKKG